MSGAYKRYWMRTAEPILRARDRLASGDVPLEKVREVAMAAFGDEEVAEMCHVAKMEALNRSASLRGE